MARPIDTERPAKQARILAAARGLILAERFETVSLRAVAAAAGFSPASLYEYFPDKSSLFAAVADDAWRRLGRSMRRVAKSHPDPIERLVAMCEAYIRFSAENKEEFLLLFSRLPSPRTRIDDPVPAGSGLAALQETVAEAVRAGLVQAAGPQDELTIVYGLWSATHGMAHLRLLHLADFEADFSEVNRLVLQAVTRGFSAS